MKILILKPSSLGDVVQAIPVLRLLKAHHPGNDIYWWVSSELADLLRDDPDLSGLFLFERRHWASPRVWRGTIRSILEMRQHRFDWVIDLQGLARSSLVAWLAKGKLTVGLEDWREGAVGLYDVAVPRPSSTTHAVDWYLQVLKVLDVPVHWDFDWIAKRPSALEAVQRKWNPSRDRWVIVNPGARWLNKRWPADFYAAVVRELAACSRDLHFAVLGGAADVPLGAVISAAERERCLDLTGRTTLPEMIEWLRIGAVVVTNDTGPMHIAAALGKPVISMFGPTDPRRTGPYRQIDDTLHIDLPCAPCLQARCHNRQPMECLRGISPSSVTSRIKKQLNLE